jgi:hypothetical protein
MNALVELPQIECTTRCARCDDFEGLLLEGAKKEKLVKRGCAN